MSKIHSTFRRNMSKSVDQDCVDHINAYWGVDVVTCNSYGTKHSNFNGGGVPRVADNSNFRHADIIRIKRFGRRWEVVK